MAMTIGFIVGIAIQKAEVTVLNTGKLNLASQRTKEHCKSERLNVIHRIGIPFVIIRVQN